MAKFLIEETVAPKGIAGILEKPEDRAKVLRPLFETAGCKLEQFYASLIENKTYLIVESPDLNSVFALWANFVAAGAASAIKCTPLIAVSEGVGLFKKAAKLGYRPPGKAGK
jgi:uncharacterized protein with GYD domain